VADFCEAYLTYFLAQEEVIALVLREVFGLGGAPMAAFARTLGDDVREPLDTMLRQGMEAGRFRDDEVVPCATAITGILNMFILARVFAGADIHVDAALRQVSYYVQGLLKQP